MSFCHRRSTIYLISLLFLLNGATYSFAPPSFIQFRSKKSKRVLRQVGPTCLFLASSSASSGSNASDDSPDDTASTSANTTPKKDEEPLTPSTVAQLVEVSFVKSVLQLAQGYVDVLKLFIAAVQSGYTLDMTLEYLLEEITKCTNESAGRPLMDEEVQLRTTWIHVIYLVLQHVQYKDKGMQDLRLESDSSSNVKQGLNTEAISMYSDCIPLVAEAHGMGQVFESERIMDVCREVLSTAKNEDDPIQQAIVSQSLRVIWMTLTCLQEEAECLPAQSGPPRPPIPGTF